MQNERKHPTSSSPGLIPCQLKKTFSVVILMYSSYKKRTLLSWADLGGLVSQDVDHLEATDYGLEQMGDLRLIPHV